jgi:hypothetical protein
MKRVGFEPMPRPIPPHPMTFASLSRPAGTPTFTDAGDYVRMRAVGQRLEGIVEQSRVPILPDVIIKSSREAAGHFESLGY